VVDAVGAVVAAADVDEVAAPDATGAMPTAALVEVVETPFESLLHAAMAIVAMAVPAAIPAATVMTRERHGRRSFMGWSIPVR